MDCRPKAAAVAALLLAAGGAWAQGSSEDSRELEGSSIYGNRELPKGLSIVPWRKAEPGEISSGPVRLVDVPLEPIDPEVFRRELEYGNADDSAP